MNSPPPKKELKYKMFHEVPKNWAKLQNRPMKFPPKKKKKQQLKKTHNSQNTGERSSKRKTK
jgi:hypothetical protein